MEQSKNVVYNKKLAEAGTSIQLTIEANFYCIAYNYYEEKRPETRFLALLSLYDRELAMEAVVELSKMTEEKILSLPFLPFGYYHAGVAQLEVQDPCKVEVVGSSPTSSTNNT